MIIIPNSPTVTISYNPLISLCILSSFRQHLVLSGASTLSADLFLSASLRLTITPTPFTLSYYTPPTLSSIRLSAFSSLGHLLFLSLGFKS